MARRVSLTMLALMLPACKWGGRPVGESALQTLYVAPPGILYPNSVPFTASDVARLATGVRDTDSLRVYSSQDGPVREPDLPPLVPRPPDLEIMGYQKSAFLVDSRWATIRYLGDSPAGAGLEGEAHDRAQLQALGQKGDSLPVTTAAWAVTRIMADYFAPLLEALPGGKEILSQFKVQGAYFSPGFMPQGVKSERDNAFMVGLQSLYLWPSSCFERSAGGECKAPYLSTGHDPTVVGHEVAHAVFNHLRRGQSLDGFQWIAVNEGYADYFSAAYFSEPVLGRIWKVSSAKQPYLRALNRDVTADDPKLIEEAHQFGIVWGATLWKIRNRLIAEAGVRGPEVDRVMLHAIRFLGETGKIRLGDAASSVLKSAEALDVSPWKAVMREEFERARVSMGGNRFSSDSLPLDASLSASGATGAGGKESSKGACGVVANANQSKSEWIFTLAPFLAVLALAYGRRTS